MDLFLDVIMLGFKTIKIERKQCSLLICKIQLLSKMKNRTEVSSRVDYTQVFSRLYSLKKLHLIPKDGLPGNS